MSTLHQSVSLRGSIEAGFPSPAEEELTDILSLDDYLGTRKPARFLLKVAGDSMRDAGMLPNDLVLVDRSYRPRDGNIVIAHVDGAWTMKYYRQRGRTICLDPANAHYRTITATSELKVVAVVTALIRTY